MITDIIYLLSGRCYNFEALIYTGESSKNLKNVSPANLVQVGLAEFCHF
jgi:hypothetical protein